MRLPQDSCFTVTGCARSIVRSGVLSILATLTFATSARALQSCSVERASSTAQGTEARLGFDLASATLSADGEHAAWCSDASDFVSDDHNGVYDVFVRDLRANTTERVSVDTDGREGPRASGIYGLDISGDGRWVVFATASSLVHNDTNGRLDVYARDRTTQRTWLVSAAENGFSGNDDSAWPVISADGTCVAFVSFSTDLVRGASNRIGAVFVRDLARGVTECVNVDSNGVEGSRRRIGARDGIHAAISADGRFVAFNSDCDDLAPDDARSCGGIDHVFVRDRVARTTRRIRVEDDDREFAVSSILPSISADGRWVVFVTSPADRIAGELARNNVYVHDNSSGATTRLFARTDAAPFASQQFRISGDGRYVLFHAPTNSGSERTSPDAVFRLERETGLTTRIDRPSELRSSKVLARAISRDGSAILWTSSPNDVPADSHPLPVAHVSRCTDASFEAFCFGDASTCPCANANSARAGCDNSMRVGGASLEARGVARIGEDALCLIGTGMPDSAALYMQGDARANGGVGRSFGDGLLCVGGSLVRIASLTNASGGSRFPADSTSSVSRPGGIFAPCVRHYQIWYRDAAPYCTPAIFNATNGVSVEWKF